MRFFVDTANLEDIKRAFELGVISGVTTNPLIIQNEDTRDIESQVKKIRSVCDGEIFSQVLGRSTDQMVEQARKINSWDDNMTVKVPLNREGICAVSILSKEGIRTCTTITFNPAQALMAAMAGATYVALFVNRSNDICSDGFELVKTVSKMYKETGLKTQVLAASINTPMDVARVAISGADAVTAPPATWEAMLKNRTTDATIDEFLAEWGGVEL